MNISRRLVTALLITLSCLFAIPPAGAEHAFDHPSGDNSCKTIGPTVFHLGLGIVSRSDAMLNAPPCHESEAKTNSGSNAAPGTVRVIIEGSIIAMNEEPVSAMNADSDLADSGDASASQQTGRSRQSGVQ